MERARAESGATLVGFNWDAPAWGDAQSPAEFARQIRASSLGNAWNITADDEAVYLANRDGAIEDRGGTILSTGESALNARTLVLLAEAKGWNTLDAVGSEDQLRLIVAEAEGHAPQVRTSTVQPEQTIPTEREVAQARDLAAAATEQRPETSAVATAMERVRAEADADLIAFNNEEPAWGRAETPAAFAREIRASSLGNAWNVTADEQAVYLVNNGGTIQDRGGTMLSTGETALSARTLVLLAEAKGWTTLDVVGSEEQRQLIAAESLAFAPEVRTPAFTASAPDDRTLVRAEAVALLQELDETVGELRLSATEASAPPWGEHPDARDFARSLVRSRLGDLWKIEETASGIELRSGDTTIRDNGSDIVITSVDEKTLAAALTIAEAKGWTEVAAEGPEAFRLAAALSAKERAMEISGLDVSGDFAREFHSAKSAMIAQENDRGQGFEW